jgi:type IV pilus assembly protein PilA
MSGRPTTGERGFTMVELLVVLLLLGILAMIALPSFIGQRDKGYDNEAQTMIRTAQLALKTHETDHDTFDADPTELVKIEPAIAEATADFKVTGTKTTFTITERSHSGTKFTLELEASGKTKRTCDDPGHGLCRATADADDNRW